MKIRFYFIALSIAAISFVSCIDDYELTHDEEVAELQEKYEHIVELAQSETCEEASGWDIVAVGTKDCGGPESYIPYSISIDTVRLFQLIRIYNKTQAYYHEKWGTVSDCSETPQPAGVTCENGEPVLTY